MRPFNGGAAAARPAMRFSANQLKLLQESLSPPPPQLTAPLELTCDPQPPAPRAGAAPAQQASARQSTWVPCWVLAPAYVSTCFFLLCVAAVWPSQLPRALLFAGAAPLPGALLLHALATPQSRPAQLLAAACVLYLPPACGSALQEAVAGGAVLASAFFAAAASSQPCHRVLRLLAPAFTLLVASCGTVACVSAGSPQLQRSAWLVLVGAVSFQAAACSLKLRSFELVCTARSSA